MPGTQWKFGHEMGIQQLLVIFRLSQRGGFMELLMVLSIAEVE